MARRSGPDPSEANAPTTAGRAGDGLPVTRRVEVDALLERQRFGQRYWLRELDLRTLDRRPQLPGPLTGHHAPWIPSSDRGGAGVTADDLYPGMVIVLVKCQAS
jgi:hypothetical protein